ncbi:hypothetical protein C1N53_16850 [Pontibacter sp. SGAir0037]|nr:hypothetical protein C1N53_16850 [Pontibacter sp. SGAir0037]
MPPHPTHWPRQGQSLPAHARPHPTPGKDLIVLQQPNRVLQNPLQVEPSLLKEILFHPYTVLHCKHFCLIRFTNFNGFNNCSESFFEEDYGAATEKNMQ